MKNKEIKKEPNYHCDICSKPIHVEWCCNDLFGCGCMGLPITSTVCSSYCYDKLMKDLDKENSNK